VFVKQTWKYFSVWRILFFYYQKLKNNYTFWRLISIFIEKLKINYINIKNFSWLKKSPKNLYTISTKNLCEQTNDGYNFCSDQKEQNINIYLTSIPEKTTWHLTIEPLPISVFFRSTLQTQESDREREKDRERKRDWTTLWSRERKQKPHHQRESEKKKSPLVSV